MSIVLNSHIKDFCSNFGFEESKLTADKIFEYFCCYSVASTYHKSETITSDIITDINTGCTNDWGIDGFIIVVNGTLVTEIDEIKNLLETNGYLDVHFLLLQAKTSSRIDSGEAGKFLDGCNSVFLGMDNSDLRPKANESILSYCDMTDFIYENAAKFKDGNEPQLDIFYIYKGIYEGVEELESKIKKSKLDLSKGHLFSDVRHRIIDENSLIEIYKATKEKLNAEITVGNDTITLPDVENISDGYLCIVPFKEFKQLIIDEHGDIIQGAFEDNVRDFQGNNRVNQSMSNSIRNGEIALFTMMNNGITVIAKEVRRLRNKLYLSDYQIVNGCQTSHVLQQNVCAPGIDELKLLVKFIGSEDKAIRDKIILGNNSQTEVHQEQLVALLESHRQIEEYYLAQSKHEKLYYERRSKQYHNDPLVNNKCIITVSIQIKAFIAMILQEPHKIRGYYGEILNIYKKEDKPLVDTKKYNPAFFYTSGLAIYRMFELIKNGTVDSKYKKVKFHLLLAFKLLAQKRSISIPAKSKDAEEYCNLICDVLMDPSQYIKHFKNACKVIDYVLDRNPNDSDRFKKEFTKSLISTIIRNKNKSTQNSIQSQLGKTTETLKPSDILTSINNHPKIKSLNSNNKTNTNNKVADVDTTTSANFMTNPDDKSNEIFELEKIKLQAPKIIGKIDLSVFEKRQAQNGDNH